MAVGGEPVDVACVGDDGGGADEPDAGDGHQLVSGVGQGVSDPGFELFDVLDAFEGFGGFEADGERQGLVMRVGVVCDEFGEAVQGCAAAESG